MTKNIRTILLGISILAIAGMLNFVAADLAGACNWGQSGGSDYVPQRRGSSGFLAKKADVSEDQARDIVTNYVKKLNPTLEIGQVKDNGGFYEVEIVDEGQEVVQLLGVDKRSGRLILLN
jgi:hypothetical protein